MPGKTYTVPVPNNMGIVRYVLALAVVIDHFNLLTGSSVPFPVSSYQGVGGFFALSGFLIYGSYLRKGSAVQYFYARARRILPAYWMTVLLCALGLSLASTLGARDYFTSAHFWRYLGANMSFLNFLEPTLPGVFADSVLPSADASLWTMKVEWCLYATPPLVVWLLRRTRLRGPVVFAAIYVLACAYRALLLWLYERTGSEIYSILGRQFLGQLSYFYVGVLWCRFLPALLRHKAVTGLACLAAMIAADYIPAYGLWLEPAVMGTAVVWVSMVGRWGTWEGRRDNVSYNIYLLHWPVIQLLVQYGACTLPSAASLAIALVATAALSLLMNAAEHALRARLPRSLPPR